MSRTFWLEHVLNRSRLFLVSQMLSHLRHLHTWREEPRRFSWMTGSLGIQLSWARSFMKKNSHSLSLHLSIWMNLSCILSISIFLWLFHIFLSFYLNLCLSLLLFLSLFSLFSLSFSTFAHLSQEVFPNFRSLFPSLFLSLSGVLSFPFFHFQLFH